MKKKYTILLSVFLLSMASAFAQTRTQLYQGYRTPRLTCAQRDVLNTATEQAKGTVIYNIDTACLEYWNGTEWISLCGDPKREGVKIGNTIWATRNVDLPGTFAANPWDCGKIYQWNSNLAWSTEDPLINHLGGTTWVSPVPANDTGWEAANDPCPEGWKVPTNEQIDELITLVKTEYKDTYVADYKGTGVEGVTITYCDNEIFFPIPKYSRWQNGEIVSSHAAIYWSGSPSSPDRPRNIAFYRESVDSSDDRWVSIIITNLEFGNYVRCVAEEE
jgi:uncharacterized protein (TIGR02145 family)